MTYVDFLKTQVGNLRGLFLPYDRTGRVALPERGDKPCDYCGDRTIRNNRCFHEAHCAARQYYLQNGSANTVASG